jgi:hypothetical protein
MVGIGVCSRSMAAEPAGGDVHQIFDETAVERLPVRRLSAALTASSTTHCDVDDADFKVELVPESLSAIAVPAAALCRTSILRVSTI